MFKIFVCQVIHLHCNYIFQGINTLYIVALTTTGSEKWWYSYSLISTLTFSSTRPWQLRGAAGSISYTKRKQTWNKNKIIKLLYRDGIASLYILYARYLTPWTHFIFSKVSNTGLKNILKSYSRHLHNWSIIKSNYTNVKKSLVFLWCRSKGSITWKKS